MTERVLKGENLGSDQPFATQILEFQRRYTTLLGELASKGTEVERTLVSEQDLDIEPYNFTRDARHVFVFPPQETELRDKEGEDVGDIPGTELYVLTRVAMSAEFDPEKVSANLVITYDDAGGEPVLCINDTWDGGLETMANLPEAARAAVDAAVETVSARSAS